LSYRLLVVDDDPQFLQMMELLLAEEGYFPELCQSSRDAYHLARQLQPDIITLDLRMPAPSGWDILQSLKTDSALAQVPVLVISAAGAELAETTERLRELDYPGVEVIAKPFEIEELLSRLADAALSVREPIDC
jgi:DNA-binding response OmpR family regulator